MHPLKNCLLGTCYLDVEYWYYFELLKHPEYVSKEIRIHTHSIFGAPVTSGLIFEFHSCFTIATANFGLSRLERATRGECVYEQSHVRKKKDHPVR